MEGPLLIDHPDDEWIQHLDDEDVEAWYHNPRTYAFLKRLGLHGLADKIAPGGYSRSDQDGVPDADDRVVLRRSVLQGALRAVAVLDEKGTPARSDLKALRLAAHEFFHCKVPWRGTVPDRQYREAERTYGHPAAALPAIGHAFERDFAVNAFTGLLRHHNAPHGAWVEACSWLRGRYAERMT